MYTHFIGAGPLPPLLLTQFVNTRLTTEYKFVAGDLQFSLGKRGKKKDKQKIVHLTHTIFDFEIDYLLFTFFFLLLV